MPANGPAQQGFFSAVYKPIKKRPSMEIKVRTRTLASFRFSLSQVSNPPLSFRLWIPLRASLDQAAARPLANGERADPTVIYSLTSFFISSLYFCDEINLFQLGVTI